MELRNYQSELVNGIKQSILRGNKRIMVQSPPRSGKTVVMAHIAKGATDKGNTVLFFSHRKEINEQVVNTFKRNGVDMELVTIDSVTKVARNLDRISEPSIILIDEAHHVKAKTYLKIIEYYTNSVVLMFTGTPARLDGSGFDDIADDIVLGKSVKWLQENGNIAPFKYYAPSLIDTTNLKKRGGEFTKKSVDDTMKRVIYGDVIRHYEKLAKGKQAIVYTHSVEASESVSNTFNEHGYSSIAISGKTPPEERERAMRAFRDGELTIMVNCELFTEGIDLPNVDVCIMLRPTQSLSLYLQFAMRALNPREGKTAIIIDHVGNVNRHGLPNDDREWSLSGVSKQKQKAKLGEPTTRTCDECYATFWSAERICPLCGHENQPTKEEIEILREIELEERRQAINEKVETFVTSDQCQTIAELQAFAKQHGYKPGWVFVQQEFGSIKDGTYEVTIDLAKQDATQGGADFLDIRFRIRKDFQQEHQNNIIFHRIFAKKEDGKYPVGSIMNLAKAAGIPDGTKFSSLEDYLNQLEGKALKVTVKNEKSEWQGKTYENLNVKRMEVTELPLPAGNPMDISDDALPF